MKSSQAVGLFVIPSIIWGSTWYAITFQLGVVDPIVSVTYRSALAGALLLVYSLLTKKNLVYGLRDHLMLFTQGVLLYGVNYWLLYIAEGTIPSGLAALIFSLAVFWNVIFGNLFLKIAIQRTILVGAALGLLGIFVIFYKELVIMDFSDAYLWSIVYSLIGVVSASLGTIVAFYNHKRNIPVIQSNAYGMMYGALALAFVALASGKRFEFDWSVAYVGSLLYLAVFGSIVAFNSYLKLLSLWGPGKAAYIVLITPVIAVFLSYLFEGYRLTAYTFAGATLVLLGNYFVVRLRAKG